MNENCAETSKMPGIARVKPVATINMRWNDTVVLLHGDTKATLHFASNGTIEGKIETDIKLSR